LEGLTSDFGAVRGEKTGFKEEMRERDIFAMNKILEDVWDPTMIQLVYNKSEIMH
jgi:hypothetical protein